MHTKGSTTDALFHSFLRVRICAFRSARVSIQLEGESGEITLTTAVVYGNLEADLDTNGPAEWPTSPSTLSANGVDWGDAFGTFDVAYQLVDVGLLVKNQSGTKMEMGAR